MDPPPPGPFAQGKDLLEMLGALDPSGRVTRLGKEIVKLPLHPRLAGMLLKSRELESEPLAADIAAILSERDIVRRDRDFPNADIRTRLDILEEARQKNNKGRHAGSLQQVQRVRQDLVRRLKIRDAPLDSRLAGVLLAFAYPDRIGELRAGSQLQYRLSGGRGARLAENDKLQGEPFIVVAELDGKGRDARIDLAAPISSADIETFFADQIVEVRRVFWDEKKERVRAQTERKLGALVLETRRINQPAPEEISTALLEAIRGKELKALPWDAESLSFIDRVNFARCHGPEGEWPDLSLAALEETLEDWLLPYLAGMSSLSDVQRLNMVDILKTRLSWEQQARLDKFAPASVKVPSGSRIRLDYSEAENPVLAVRLQGNIWLE